MPTTSGNALTLLLTVLFSSLRNQYHKLFLFSKSTTLALYLQSPTTANVFGKQSTNSYTANPLRRHHFSWHFTCRQLRLFFTKINNSSQKVGGYNAYPDPAPKKWVGPDPENTGSTPLKVVPTGAQLSPSYKN